MEVEDDKKGAKRNKEIHRNVVRFLEEMCPNCVEARSHYQNWMKNGS
jgi:hypothetical protein